MNCKTSRVLHRRITDILKQRILKGKYPSDGKLPSENELVKEFKVSKHTLLKALNALINQGLIIRKQGCGTFVAPAVNERQNRRIGVIVYHSDSPYYSKIIRGIEDYASQKGFGVILCNSTGDMGKESRYIERFMDEVDGFIVCPVEEKSEYSDGIKIIIESEVPLTLVSHIAVNQLTASTNYVIPDNCTGGFLAGKHLAECGYKKLAILVCEAIERESMRERLKGFKLALLQYGIPFEASMIIEASNNDAEHGYMQNGYDSAPEIMRFCGKETCGIFAVGDSLGIGLFKGLKELGANVPEQIGICGFDDIALASQWDIGLTTVAQDAAFIGRKSAEIIIENIENSGKHMPSSHIVVPVELKKRKTTKPLNGR